MPGPPERYAHRLFVHKLVDEVALIVSALAMANRTASNLLPPTFDAVSESSMIDESVQLARLRSLRYLIEETARIADEGGLSEIAVQLWIAHDKVMHDMRLVEASTDGRPQR